MRLHTFGDPFRFATAIGTLVTFSLALAWILLAFQSPTLSPSLSPSTSPNSGGGASEQDTNDPTTDMLTGVAKMAGAAMFGGSAAGFVPTGAALNFVKGMLSRPPPSNVETPWLQYALVITLTIFAVAAFVWHTLLFLESCKHPSARRVVTAGKAMVLVLVDTLFASCMFVLSVLVLVPSCVAKISGSAPKNGIWDTAVDALASVATGAQEGVKQVAGDAVGGSDSALGQLTSGAVDTAAHLGKEALKGVTGGAVDLNPVQQREQQVGAMASQQSLLNTVSLTAAVFGLLTVGLAAVVLFRFVHKKSKQFSLPNVTDTSNNKLKLKDGNRGGFSVHVR